MGGKSNLNLVPAIEEMARQINKVKQEYKTKINELEDGLKALRNLNTVCERCNGSGSIPKPRSCAEDDDRYPVSCPSCHGSGKSK